MTKKLAEGSLPLEPLEAVYERMNQFEDGGNTTVHDLEIMIDVNTQLDEEQQEYLKRKYVEGGYIELEGDVDDPQATIKKAKVEKLKEDIDYTEVFELPDDLGKKPSAKELSYHFTPWVVRNRDIRAVILDVERDSYEYWAYDSDEKIWKNNGRQRLIEAGHNQLGKHYSKHLREEIEERLKAEKQKYFEEMGLPSGKIAVKNGVLDFENNEIRDLRKKDFATSKLPVAADGNITDNPAPELWENYLEDSVPSEEAKKTLQEFAGYCLMPWTCKYERGLMLLGPTDSGKSVFLDVMRALLGHQNISQESLQELANTRWSRASIKGKLANIDHDLDPRAIEDIGMVKKLTSGNGIMAEYKHENKFKLKPRAKMMFSANRVPDRTEEDDAFYNRWLTVTFPQTIPPEEQDKELVEKLTGLRDIEEREESDKYDGYLDDILRWALKGMKRLEQQEGFTGDLDPLATKELWKQWGNSVERFISRYCVKKGEVDQETAQQEDFKVHFSTLYDLYQEYARVNGMETESQKAFTSKILRDPEIRKGQPSIGGQQQRGFFGIKLQEDAAEQIEESSRDEWN